MSTLKYIEKQKRRLDEMLMLARPLSPIDHLECGSLVRELLVLDPDYNAFGNPIVQYFQGFQGLQIIYAATSVSRLTLSRVSGS